MDKVFNDVQETRSRLGQGSGLYTSYFQQDGKFALLIPTIDAPFIGSEVGEQEIKVSTSSTITKIEGVETLNATESGVYLHRDAIELLEKLNGKTVPLISLAGDGSGYEFSGTISYKVNNAEMDTPWQGTLKITPVTKPMFNSKVISKVKPTALFASVIPAKVDLSSTTGTYELNGIEFKYTGTTVEAKVDDEAICGAQISDNKLTITGKKEGYAVVHLTTKKEGYASWETSILV